LCNVGYGHSLPVILDGVTDRSIPRTFQWGTDRMPAIEDLCQSYQLAYGVRPDGYLHVWPRRDGRLPVASYAAADLLLDAPRTSIDRQPNRFVVVGSSGSGDDEQRWTASGMNDSAPFDVEGYGVVTERTETVSATSQAMVTAALETRMRKAGMATRKRSVEIAADWRIEGFDVIALHPDEQAPFVGEVQAYSMPLSEPDARMRVDVTELNW
jgi:hypothetical protein